MLRVLLSGAAGSGKGTIGRMLAKEFDGFTYFSSGDLIRDHVQRGTEFGVRAAPFMLKGEHIPDGLLNGMLLSAVLQVGDKIILDGFPRSMYQVKMVEEKAPVHLCVEIKVPKKVLIERMSKQLVHPASGREYNLDFNPPKLTGKDDVSGEPLFRRADDAVEVVRRRLEVHEKTESKVIDYYKKQGNCLSVSGESSAQVFQQVSEAMRDMLTNRKGKGAQG